MALNKVTVPITAANGATIKSFVATGNVDQYPQVEMIERVVPTLRRTARGSVTNPVPWLDAERVHAQGLYRLSETQLLARLDLLIALSGNRSPHLGRCNLERAIN
jgi:hypothetical protein